VDMDARGLVAVIVTVHELAVLLGLMVAVLVALLGTLLVRNGSSLKRVLTVAAFAIGGGLITFGVSSRLFQVSALDVEVVRLND
jgi:hypothetical protein